MSEHPIEVKGVWKKFRKGDKVYALRDVIPSLAKGLFKKNDRKKKLTEDEFWVLQNINFHVKKGEVLGIIGPNGAGKSTILKVLSRLLTQDEGTVNINGRLSALIEVTAGFHPDFTGRENIYFNGSILGMSKEELDKKFQDIVDFSGVEEFIDTPVKRYSSGMAARLGFAISAHVDPDILLVDEVLSVGDMTFQKKCTEKMRDLLTKGTTIIFISHNIPLMQSMCERILLLDKGQIIKEGYPEEVIPFYERLEFEGRQQQILEELNNTTTDDLRSKKTSLIKIKKVNVVDEEHNPCEYFSYGDQLNIDFEYEAAVDTDEYVFCYEIIRADGKNCCVSNTIKDKCKIDTKKGINSLSIHINKLELTPGVYYTKVSIWDKDMIHPYIIHKEGVFNVKLQMDIHGRNMGAVYYPETKWIV